MTDNLSYDELLERAEPFLRHQPGKHNQESHGNDSVAELFSGFVVSSTIKGTFGELGMGFRDNGKARIAWSDTVVDLPSAEIVDVGRWVDDLRESRFNDLADPNATGLLDSVAVGPHKVDLVAGGRIDVTFAGAPVLTLNGLGARGDAGKFGKLMDRLLDDDAMDNVPVYDLRSLAAPFLTLPDAEVRKP